MKVEINGIKFEDVSINEAFELVSKLNKKSEKRKFNAKPRWTKEENNIILQGHSLKKLVKLIPRHNKRGIALQIHRMNKGLR